MKIFGWAIILFLGISVINIVARRIKTLEKLGLAMPLGMGVNSALMFTLDLFHISVTQINLLLGIEGLIIAVLTFYSHSKNNIVLHLRLPPLKINFKNIININLAWLLMVGYSAYIIYVIVYRALDWPALTFDSIFGFDFIAKVLSKEGTLNNFIFNGENTLYSVRSLYPPLVPYNFGFAYLLGYNTSQIVVVFFFISIYISFYSILSNYTTSLAAAFFSFLLIITPEFASFSSLSSTNPPCTYYSAIGMLCLFTYHKNQDVGYFFLGTILIALAIWTRAEAIIFAGACMLFLLKRQFNKTQMRLVLIFLSSCAVAFLAWQFYLKFVLHVAHAEPIIKVIYWDSEKFLRMIDQVISVTFNTKYYGLVIYMFIVLVLINANNIIKKKDNLSLLGAIIFSWVLYLLVYYQLNTDYKDVSTGGWINSGYRRGMFYFLPLLLFYCANNKISDSLFKKYLVF